MDNANRSLHRGVAEEGGARPPGEHFPKGVKPALGSEPKLEGVAQVGKAGRGRRPRGVVQGQLQWDEQGPGGQRASVLAALKNFHCVFLATPPRGMREAAE